MANPLIVQRGHTLDGLGEYYRDASGELMTAYSNLAARYPGHVHALLGNHEHGHIGGPHTAKFAADEVILLENILGPAGTDKLREVVATFALAAIAPCGAGFTHGATAGQLSVGARLLAAGDAYDAMTASRTYRAALPHSVAAAELRAKAGTHFDRDVVIATLKTLNRLAPDPEAFSPGAPAPLHHAPAWRG